MTDGSLALTLLRAAVSLALVLALLIWSMRVLARRGGFTPSAKVASVTVDVVGRRQLARGASVQVVRVGEQTLVLGVTESEVRVLTDLSPEELPADEEPEQDLTVGRAGASAVTPSFADALRRQGTFGRLIADAGRRKSGGRHRGGSRV